MSSFTLTLTERGKSELHANFFPPIQLDSPDWTVGLTSFDSYFSIPNFIENVNSNLYLQDEDVKIHDTTGRFVDENQIKHFVESAYPGIRITIVDHCVNIKCDKTLFNNEKDSILLAMGFKKGIIIPATTTKMISARNPLKKSWSASLKKHVYGMELYEGQQYVISAGTVYKIPTGTYELNDLHALLKGELKDLGIEFEMKPNLNTQRCGIKCSKRILFNVPDSFATLLGFKDSITLEPNKWNWSTGIIHIFKVLNIGISVSCCQGDYRNGEPSHIIYQFSPSVAPGYRMAETPESVTYHSVIGNKLEEISVKVLDQDGQLINFGDEIISIRLHFKKQSV